MPVQFADSDSMAVSHIPEETKMSRHADVVTDRKPAIRFPGPAILRALGAMIGGLAIGCAISLMVVEPSSKFVLAISLACGFAMTVLSVFSSAKDGHCRTTCVSGEIDSKKSPKVG